MTPSTQPNVVRGPIRRPEYRVRLDLPGEDGRDYRIEAADLDDLADIIEREIRAKYPSHHVGVRLDPDGTVWARIAMKDSHAAGTWAPAESRSS